MTKAQGGDDRRGAQITGAKWGAQLGEDMEARLKTAEQEAAKLRAELDTLPAAPP